MRHPHNDWAPQISACLSSERWKLRVIVGFHRCLAFLNEDIRVVFLLFVAEVKQKTNFRYDGAETSSDHIYHLSCMLSSFITSGLWQLRVLVAGFGGIDLVSWDLHTKR